TSRRRAGTLGEARILANGGAATSDGRHRGRRRGPAGHPRAGRGQEALRRWIDPFTVSISRAWPPPPMLPERRRGPRRPETVRGKSVSISPFTVWARTFAAAEAGRVRVMLPFTVRNETSLVQSARPALARIDPFTVSASTRPVVATSMEPFTVVAWTSASRPCPATFPLTVAGAKTTPRGTRTVKWTSTSLSRGLLCPPPAPHSLGRP